MPWQKGTLGITVQRGRCSSTLRPPPPPLHVPGAQLMSVLMLSSGCALAGTSAVLMIRRRGYRWGAVQNLSTLSWLAFRLKWKEAIQMTRLSCLYFCCMLSRLLHYMGKYVDTESDAPMLEAQGSLKLIFSVINKCVKLYCML